MMCVRGAMRGNGVKWTGLVVVMAANGVAQAWEVRRMHPFVEAKADDLGGALGSSVERLVLAGPKNDWIHEVMDREPCWVTRLYESYIGPEGGEFLQYVGRTEHLTEHLTVVLRRLGYEVPDLSGRVPVNTVPISVEQDEGLRQEVTEHEVGAYRRWASPKTDFLGVSVPR